MNEDEAVAWAIEELVAQIEIRSISDHGDRMMAYLDARCRSLGFPTAVQPIEGAGPNVVVRWDGRTDPKNFFYLVSNQETLDAVSPKIVDEAGLEDPGSFEHAIPYAIPENYDAWQEAWREIKAA